MDLEKIIIQTLIEYQFGDNLKNGDYITGVKKLYFGEVAATVVKKQIIMSTLKAANVSKQHELLIALVKDVAEWDKDYSSTNLKLRAKKLLSNL